jgi:hypothetical protein
MRSDYCENMLSLATISVVSTKCIDPRVLEFVVSNATGNNQWENCISLHFNCLWSKIEICICENGESCYKKYIIVYWKCLNFYSMSSHLLVRVHPLTSEVPSKYCCQEWDQGMLNVLVCWLFHIAILEYITEAITKRYKVILILTDHFIKSKWCEYQA